MAEKRIAIIGCGNLGLSIVGGLIRNPDVPNKSIIATRRKVAKIQHLSAKDVQVTDNNLTAVKSAQIIILAVKPYNLLDVCQEIKAALSDEEHVLVSLASGVTTAEIQQVVGKKLSVLRAMPNIAAEIDESMTCICGESVSKEDYQLVEMLFNSIGKTVRINEELMEAATVLGACGIAFVMRFMRAMVQGGIQIGFDANTAGKIVNQTVKGAASLLVENKQHPEFEIDKVTTPKGCTIVGLNEMEHNGFSSALIKGIVASQEELEK